MTPFCCISWLITSEKWFCANTFGTDWLNKCLVKDIDFDTEKNILIVFPTRAMF